MSAETPDARCETCRFCRKAHGWDEGRCRRHSPISPFIVRTNSDHTAHAEWPKVSLRDWCGDYEKAAAELDP